MRENRTKRIRNIERRKNGREFGQGSKKGRDEGLDGRGTIFFFNVFQGLKIPAGRTFWLAIVGSFYYCRNRREGNRSKTRKKSNRFSKKTAKENILDTTQNEIQKIQNRKKKGIRPVEVSYEELKKTARLFFFPLRTSWFVLFFFFLEGGRVSLDDLGSSHST